MEIDRRRLLAVAAGASTAWAAGVRANSRPDWFAACCRDAAGQYAALVCDASNGIVRRIDLATRGHDIAVRPHAQECVVFARRPGRHAVAFSPQGGEPPRHFSAGDARHFYGHGVFSADGRLLYSSEAVIGEDDGRIGVRDATGGYRQIGEFRSGGIGPHDMALLADGRTLVIANGGLVTDGDRSPLNLSTMEPSLTYIDTATGDLLEKHVLDAVYQKLSIRHLAVAAGDVVVAGCQYEGLDGTQPSLVVFHQRGRTPRLLDAPSNVFRLMRNYVGSVAVDRSGEIAVATSPKSGVALMIDVAARRIIGEERLADVCGASGRHRGGGFLLTTGSGVVAGWDRSGASETRLTFDGIAWDNHAISLHMLD